MARPKISEKLKADIGLVGQTINNSNATGMYYDMRGYRKAIAVCIDGENAINKVTKVEFLQATAAAGTGAKVVKQGNASAGTESSASNSAAALVLTKQTVATITCALAANADTITINGITYTAHTNTTTAANREFAIDGTDAQDATALYGLLTHATYGLGSGISVVDGGSGVLTLTAVDGDTTLTITTSNATRIAVASTQQILYCECDVNDLDLAGGFYWLAVKVTKAGNGIVGAVLLREHGGYPQAQQVAAGTAI